MVMMEIWNGREVPRVGLGCWAIGGPTANAGPSTSYGEVDDNQSRAALRLGYDMGARVFDTAAGYGAGHSEMLVGEEISHRADVLIVSKFGYDVDDKARTTGPQNATPDGIRATIEGSRRRLRRDCIDLMLFHTNAYPVDDAGAVFDTLEVLRSEGKIGAFGWSTDHVDRVLAVCDREGFVAVENDYNVFTPATALMKLVADRHLVSISRLPLAMGLLTGKFRPDAHLDANDVRGAGHDWLTFFKDGKPNAEYLGRLDAIKELLQTGGRTLAQGALGWILASSPAALPVPGFKSQAQVRDNLGALEKGALDPQAMHEIGMLLDGFSRA